MQLVFIGCFVQYLPIYILLIVKVSLFGADAPVDSFKVQAEPWTFKEQAYLKSEPSVTCT